MGIIELFILAIGLAMDAFAVSICKGIAVKKASFKNMLTAGLWFGGFQALMPVFGYLIGSAFEIYINFYDHWIVFVLLVFLGIKMIWSSKNNDSDNTDASFGFKSMFSYALATSIDAIAVGVTFALLPDINIFSAVTFIGIITFIFSAAGVKIGQLFGLKFKRSATITGGIILVLIGVKILFEHLDILPF